MAAQHPSPAETATLAATVLAALAGAWKALKRAVRAEAAASVAPLGAQVSGMQIDLRQLRSDFEAHVEADRVASLRLEAVLAGIQAGQREMLDEIRHEVSGPLTRLGTDVEWLKRAAAAEGRPR